jgi:hypothetical protein
MVLPDPCVRMFGFCRVVGPLKALERLFVARGGAADGQLRGGIGKGLHAAHEVGFVLGMIDPLQRESEQAGLDAFRLDIPAEHDNVGARDSLNDQPISLNLLAHDNLPNDW